MAQRLKIVAQETRSLCQKLLAGRSPPPGAWQQQAGRCSSKGFHAWGNAGGCPPAAFNKRLAFPVVLNGNRAREIGARNFSALCFSQFACKRNETIRITRAVQGCRYYFVDRGGYRHFRVRGPPAWFRGPDGQQTLQRSLILLVLVGGVFYWVYVTHLEAVPYTYRKHFILVSPALEMQLVEQHFEALKKQFKPQTLSPIHPQAVKVRRIARDVIKAVMEGVGAEDWGQTVIMSNKPALLSDNVDKLNPVASSYDKEFAQEQMDYHEIEKDEKAVKESRRKGLKQGMKPFTEHLKGLKWEVLVVDENIVNAFCLPGGKIVVFTGLLKHFDADAEIATVIGHEVAHVVARHSAERLTRNIWLAIAELFILTFFYAPDVVHSISTLFLQLPFSRRMELEADYVGLLLMAAAGYDPRVAPTLYERLSKLSGVSEITQYLATHPSGKKRGERLKKTDAMETALNIYREKMAGGLVEGFL